MIYYYTLFTIFSIIVTMMIIDQNFGEYIGLLLKLSKSQVERLYWMVRFHPVLLSSPIGRWWMMRKHMRTAEKLVQELSQKQKDVL